MSSRKVLITCFIVMLAWVFFSANSGPKPPSRFDGTEGYHLTEKVVTDLKTGCQYVVSERYSFFLRGTCEDK